MPGSAPLGAIGSAPSLRLPERFFCRLGTTTHSASQTSRRRPVSSLPVATCPRIEVHGANVLWGTAGEPAQLARRSARCPMFLSRIWLAVPKMMLRSVGRQGCGQLLAALAACTSAPCASTLRLLGHGAH